MGGNSGTAQMWRARAAEAREEKGADRPLRNKPTEGGTARALTGCAVTAITLNQAERIIDAVIQRGAALNCRPLSVIVVEPGCKVKAFKRKTGHR